MRLLLLLKILQTTGIGHWSSVSLSSLDANDLGAGPYIVNFAEGEKQACGEIPVTQDNLAEPDEQFLLQIMPNLDGVPNIMTGTMDEAQVTIKSGMHWQQYMQALAYTVCTCYTACMESIVHVSYRNRVQ